MADNDERNEEQKGSAEIGSDPAAAEQETERLSGRVDELEKTLADRESEIISLKNGLKESVESYRSLVMESNPDILPEMIGGDSVEALNESVLRAKDLIGRIKAGLESQENSLRIPAGSPQRGMIDTAGLSPGEKIRRGIR